MCGARPRLQFEGTYFSVGLIVWELCLFQVFNNVLDPMCEGVYLYNEKNICIHQSGPGGKCKVCVCVTKHSNVGVIETK